MEMFFSGLSKSHIYLQLVDLWNQPTAQILLMLFKCSFVARSIQTLSHLLRTLFLTHNSFIAFVWAKITGNPIENMNTLTSGQTKIWIWKTFAFALSSLASKTIKPAEHGETSNSAFTAIVKVICCRGKLPQTAARKRDVALGGSSD